MSQKTKKKHPQTTTTTKRAKISFPAFEIRRMLPYIGILLGVTCLGFYPSLQNGFTNWDDPTYVTENSWVIHAQWASLLQESVSLNYHPITMLSLAIDHSIWGLNPFGYHLTNLILHVANTFLVFLFIRTLAPERSVYVAFFTALFFGIHPMHVESVAWISERKDVLYVFFFLLGLWAYLRYLNREQKSWLIASFLFFVLSCLSKAMAVVFPVILLLIDYYRKRPFSTKVGIQKLPFFLFSLVIGVLAIQIQSKGAIADLESLSVIQRMLFAAYGSVFYIVKAILPVQLSAFYPYPDLTASLPPLYYLGAITALPVFMWPLWQRKKDRVLLFGLGFYLVAVALVLQLVAVGKAMAADRYTYLAYVGLFFLLCAVLYRWAAKDARKLKIIRLGLSVFAGILLVLCIQRNKVWKNSETLWTDVIEKFPERADEGYANLGSYLGKQGRVQEAIGYLQKAVAINPLHAKAYGSLGNAYGSQKLTEEAIAAFNAAIAIDDSQANFYVNRGITYARMGQPEAAKKDFTTAIALEQSPLILASIHNNRGFLRVNTGQLDGAKTDCAAALTYHPNDPVAHFCMARVLAQHQQKAEALRYARRAQQLGYQVPETFMQALR